MEVSDEPPPSRQGQGSPRPRGERQRSPEGHRVQPRLALGTTPTGTFDPATRGSVVSVITTRAAYQTSPIKRIRRTKDEVQSLLDGVLEILAEYEKAVSIRHLFYRCCEGERLLHKTERDYAKLCIHLAKWRRQRLIPWNAFADGTRFYHGVTLNGDMSAALARTAQFYRKDLWASQPYYLEVWCEKDAIRGMLTDACEPYGLPTFACRGFASLSSLSTASEMFKSAENEGKEPVVLYFGDHDPSGLEIDKKAHSTLRDDFGIEVPFIRCAITPEQITKLSLPTRPAKTTDTRAKGWVGGCVEVDTLRPEQLADIIEDEVSSRIDDDEWDKLKTIEGEERETLKAIADRFQGGWMK